MMLSVPVRFPQGMSLYPTQKLMIVRILAALKNSQNVLGESPTGSGKTMALLSSTCAWLKQYIDEKRESKEKCAVHGNFMRHEDDEDSKDGIKKEEERAKEDIKPVIGAATKKKEDLFEEQWNDDFIPHSPPTAAIVKKEVNTEVKKEAKPEPVEQKTSECTCLPQVRIYYGTRTHKQIAQVVKEFSRLPYANIIK